MTAIDTSIDPLAAETALAWFRDRIPAVDLTKIAEEERRQAWVVAGVADLDVVTDVWESLGAALSQGTSFQDFKAAVGPALERAWGGDVENPGSRLSTIFRTNVQLAYHAGRKSEARANIGDRPYQFLDVIEDQDTSDICSDLDDEIGGQPIPVDDPIWDKCYPPNHQKCRSTVITLSVDEAQALGILEDVPDPDDLEVAEGFDTDDEWSPDPSDYPDELAEDVGRFA